MYSSLVRKVLFPHFFVIERRTKHIQGVFRQSSKSNILRVKYLLQFPKFIEIHYVEVKVYLMFHHLS